MAKQTFTTGQVLTAAQMTSLQQTAMGGGSATAKTASYTLVAADAGATVIMNSASATTITVNTSLFSAGDTVFIQNIGAGVSTITPGTATVNTASSLALAQYESGSLYFTAAGASIFSKADGAAAGGGGKVLQVVQGTLNSSVNTSSGSLTDTGLTVSITPSLATSKVLVMAFHNNNYVYESASAATVLGEFALIRASTQLQNIQIGGDTLGTQTGRAFYAGASFSYLDSPSTTSATTYKTQFRKTSGSANIAIQSSATGLSSIIAMEIGA